MKNSRKYWIIGLVLLLLFCIGGFTLFGFLLFFPSVDLSDKWGNIAIVELKGPIFDSAPTIEKLEKYRKNNSVQAIVLRIDSPGGAVAPSQEIYTEVKKVVAQKKVVVSMGTVAASGGYYIAAPATKIVANPGTLTGSIGVLMEHVEVDDLLKWAKVSAEILKAGELKDTGSALRKMKPEEREVLQSILQNMHLQFLKAVSEGRNIPLDEMKKIGNGKVYTGEQALELKLVDQLGNLEDAIEVAKNLAGIQGEPKVIRPEKSKSLLKEILLGGEEESSLLLQKIMTQVGMTKILYLMSI